MASRDDEFNHVYRPGQFYLFTGERGSGKTCKVAHVAVRALEQKGITYAVVSNIVLKRKVDGRWREDYPPNFFKVTTWAQVFTLLPDLLDDYDRIILAIDEAVLSGQGSGMSTLQGEVRALLGLSTVLRKAHMAYLLIVIDESATMKNFRQVGSIISGIFRSDRRDQSRFTITTTEGRFTVTGFEPEGFARPKEAVPDGELVFDTASSASFTHGKLGGRPFDLMAALQAMSDCIEEETAQKLREYIERASNPGKKEETVIERGVREIEQRDRRTYKSGPHQKQRAIELLLDGQSTKLVAEETGLTLRRAQQIKKELREAGRI